MQALVPKSHPTLQLRCRLLALAGLLVVAQALSQFHATDHLADHGDAGHHGATCLVCIAAAGLDAGRVDAAWLPGGLSQRPCAAPATRIALVSRPLAAYRVRAPPAPASMT